MECTEKYVQKFSRKYNRRHVIAFIQKTAENRFLSPFGLTLKSFPSANFGNNCNLLKRDEETELFQALHYMKYKTSKTRIKKCKERYIQIYLALRNRGISANYPLVINCAKRHTERLPAQTDKAQFIERGYTCLINCVDGFDPWLGWRFSTYACNSIMRCFFVKTKKQHSCVSIDEINDIGSEMNDEDHELRTERLGVLLGSEVITARERRVLKHRFYDNLTLQESGNILGLSKERARQIQNKAISQLLAALNRDPILTM